MEETKKNDEISSGIDTVTAESIAVLSAVDPQDDDYDYPQDEFDIDAQTRSYLCSSLLISSPLPKSKNPARIFRNALALIKKPLIFPEEDDPDAQEPLHNISLLDEHELPQQEELPEFADESSSAFPSDTSGIEGTLDGESEVVSAASQVQAILEDARNNSTRNTGPQRKRETYLEERALEYYADTHPALVGPCHPDAPPVRHPRVLTLIMRGSYPMPKGLGTPASPRVGTKGILQSTRRNKNVAKDQRSNPTNRRRSL
ncbi:hypothetical protein PGTUg99_028768 [Puccinia graminis f. sp. tritici]|uniref:Uncharacterized protein n=1 Tax=Puccinia graminis f. sp. tritici TaxID=56615 RepID=A0A5B0RCB2_PUCGR|nr:hypothetical protein PGTUg99_016618 [Puccinia graminis f. sp. tritici]KAA1122675.1 hypothetical protein PGTUg99_005532 [Puccinia graminis f. sp. tritici]KAA1133384.1 hypothetical protein PGTUg99_028768 [Puccinia graminis f. sp. tritici]